MDDKDNSCVPSGHPLPRMPTELSKNIVPEQVRPWTQVWTAAKAHHVLHFEGLRGTPVHEKSS